MHTFNFIVPYGTIIHIEKYYSSSNGFCDYILYMIDNDFKYACIIILIINNNKFYNIQLKLYKNKMTKKRARQEGFEYSYLFLFNLI